MARRMGIAAVVGSLALGFWMAAAQTPAAPTFEVVSVKPADPGARGMAIGLAGGSEWRASNVSVRELIRYAYDLPSKEAGVPPALALSAYDIEAKLPGRVALAQMRLMVRAMLADRFQLALHSETRPMPAVTLTVAPGAAKLQPNPDCDRPQSPPLVSGGASTLQAMQEAYLAASQACGGHEFAHSDDVTTLTFHGTTMSELAKLAVIWADGMPVVDQTGITGAYDFQLEFRSIDRPGASGEDRDAMNAENRAYVETALLKQLGLKLNLAHPTKQPVPVWVVDHAAPADSELA